MCADYRESKYMAKGTISICLVHGTYIRPKGYSQVQKHCAGPDRTAGIPALTVALSKAFLGLLIFQVR